MIRDRSRGECGAWESRGTTGRHQEIPPGALPRLGSGVRFASPAPVETQKNQWPRKHPSGCFLLPRAHRNYRGSTGEAAQGKAWRAFAREKKNVRANNTRPEPINGRALRCNSGPKVQVSAAVAKLRTLGEFQRAIHEFDRGRLHKNALRY
jgi:hypothetical protein